MLGGKGTSPGCSGTGVSARGTRAGSTTTTAGGLKGIIDEGDVCTSRERRPAATSLMSTLCTGANSDTLQSAAGFVNEQRAE